MTVQLAKTQFRRVVELERMIRDGEYPNCLSFAGRAEVAQKTVQRDIDFLRDQLGAPIEYDREKRGYYYTDKNWFLPSLVLSEGGLLALLLASRTLEQFKGTPIAKELDAIFRKIEDFLPAGITVSPELVYDKFSFVGPPAKPIKEEIWVVVIRGLMCQHAVNVTYRSFGSDRNRDFVLHPYHIANLQGEWYLFAAAEGEKTVLQFSLARVRAASITQKTFKPDPSFNARKFLSGVFGRFASGDTVHHVRLLFDRDVADWVTEREWHPEQRIVKRKGGAVELTFKAKGLYEVQRWVLAWGRSVKVLAPQELQDMYGSGGNSADGERGGGR